MRKKISIKFRKQIQTSKRKGGMKDLRNEQCILIINPEISLNQRKKNLFQNKRQR